MKALFAASSLCALFGSCTFHVHVHEAPRSHETHPARAVQEPVVRGVVVDEAGRPVRALVAAVGHGGSVSNTTGEAGSFTLPLRGWPARVLHASTDDGRCAVEPLRAGNFDVRLTVRPGATVVIDMSGRPHARCAVIAGDLGSGDVLVEDFTVIAGDPAKVVVPPGGIRVRLYDGDVVHAERSLDLREGATQNVSFALGG